jgi:EAL domain-containing protein (putative c-di-GMP-specific phosphodiesterase class I)
MNFTPITAAEGTEEYQAPRLFQSAGSKKLLSTEALRPDLDRAISYNELLIHYQPLVGIETGMVECFEALVRWQHPIHGLLMPDDFIPIAEQSGAIVELGKWVLMRACADAASWSPALALAVNVSPVQVCDAEFGVVVDRALSASGLSPARLELEITESRPIDNNMHCLGLLSRLRHLGIALVMDDFGIGYSSLYYLGQFPFNKIKIDRSIIANILDDDFARSIVAAVVALGSSLNLKIVAEGVESEAQLALLQEQGCSQVQGHYLSQPMPIEFFMGSVLRIGMDLPTHRSMSQYASPAGGP